ncbi:MAG: hypothetical protein PVG61_03545 [Dehalococcoidia bacterium]|jgi:hypothetical protein
MQEQEIKQKQKQCVHYWIIDFPEGPVSTGVCKYCGMTRNFYNYFDATEQSKREELEASRKN